MLPDAVSPAMMRPLVAGTDTDIGRKVGDGQAGGLRQQIGHIVKHVDHRAVLDFPAASAGREAKVKPMCDGWPLVKCASASTPTGSLLETMLTSNEPFCRAARQVRCSGHELFSVGC